MADELIIQGLRIAGEDGTGLIVVDAIVETNFDSLSQGASRLSVEAVCREVMQLCATPDPGSLEIAATRLVDGLLECFPQVEGIDVTLRLLEPQIPDAELDAIGVRKRRRRPKPPQRLPRREIKPLPR